MNDVLARVGDRWSVQIVYALSRGTMRFNELKRELGISQRMLSQSLRDLERDGLITRRHYATIPPRVEYDLTDLGRTFREPVMALAKWAFDHRSCIEANRRAFTEAETSAGPSAEDLAEDWPAPQGAAS